MIRRAAPILVVALASVLAVALFAGCGDAVEPGAFRFAEVPPSSGFDFVHAIPGELDNTIKSAMGGVALIDYDGDGKIDVYCPNGGWDDRIAGPAAHPPEPVRAHLYRNLGGMKFEDVTDKAGVGFIGAAFGACVGDYDGDGRPDMFVPAYGKPALYRNKGDGTFEEVAEKAGIAPGFYAGATFLDYDRDGVVDLFASQYLDAADVDVALNKPGDFAPPSAYQKQSARLYRGRGDGTFEDVTAKARIGTGGKGMGVLATDADGDGWIDLLVANDTMENFLWRNKGDGSFADAAGRLGLAYGSDGEPRASMGVTGADIDTDGKIDYLVPDTMGGCVYAARDRFYTDRARDWAFAAETLRGFTGWTDVAFDAENDGRLDVWKVHGDLRNAADGQWTKVISNRGRLASGGMHFEYNPPALDQTNNLLTGEAGEVRITGRGGVAADFDDDGREDLLALDLVGRAWLLRNVTENAGGFVRLRLAGKAPNTSALGARLTARAGKIPVVREEASSTGYLSAPDLRIHVGLGGAENLDDVVVRWPNGKEQRFGKLAAGKDHVLTEE